jgi:DNA repair protein RadC
MGKIIKTYSLTLVKEGSHRYNLESTRIWTPGDAFQCIERVFKLSFKPEEHLVMLVLDAQQKIIGAMEVSHGGINCSVASPREVYKRALLLNGMGIIVAHNHPAGSLIASEEDLTFTRRLKASGEMLGIKLLDHLIISRCKYKSLIDEI